MADPRLVEWLRTAGLESGPNTLAALDAFEERLYGANRTMNLTRVPREAFWERHVVDSLLFHDVIPRGAKVLDVGSGPGFPAWPLALFRPDLRVTALDSSRKTLRFLLGSPLENLEVVEGRAEEWGVRESFDLVTGRALAPLALQLELSAAPCRVGGIVAPMRTPKDEPSLASPNFRRLGIRLERVERRALPSTGAERLMPVFVKECSTPREYPRSWAKMRSAPLDTLLKDAKESLRQAEEPEARVTQRPR